MNRAVWIRDSRAHNEQGGRTAFHRFTGTALRRGRLKPADNKQPGEQQRGTKPLGCVFSPCLGLSHNHDDEGMP
ncbi:hypothetical protein EYF80_040206 [Liparis tanakae]|uniref:Uncharacterized protein n=1 Tax=Liparis tanakae TaxID=230148 RepID=A0A4Z2G7S0_9TELE|nr:hypothetical protein EYF80_040206 [Liparis tanakae]